jgi:transposase
MKPISKDTRQSIISLLDDGLTSRQIAKNLGIGYSTINRVRLKARPDAPKHQGGRPAKLTATDKRKLVRLATSGKADTAPQLMQELKDQVNVSANTVRRALKESGLKAVTKKKKPFLKSNHVFQRYQFALKYKDYMADDWEQFVFPDETKVNRVGSDGRKWVWKRPKGQMTSQHVQGTMKFGGGSVMMWACMTARGVGCVHRIEGIMNAACYTEILESCLLKTIDDHGLERDKIIFQQDNDPKHTSRAAHQWFKDNGIKVLAWPAYSPDLNPMEHLWGRLKRSLAEYESEPSSMTELWERVKTEWEKITPEECQELIKSMPRRIAAVLKAKGRSTKY